MVKNRTNKIYSSLLLGLVALQIVLPVFIFISLHVVKQSQKVAISDTGGRNLHFEQIRINEKEATCNYKAGDEILYHGTMYDIKTVAFQNKQYIISALADTKETELQDLNASTLGKTTQQNTKEVSVVPFVFLYYEHNAGWQPLYIYETLLHPVFQKQFIAEHPVHIITPPPQGIV